MSTAAEYLPGVLRYGYTHAARHLDDADLIELIHLAIGEHRQAMDEDHRPVSIEREHGTVWQAVRTLLNAALGPRAITWQALARHPRADRPWELIEMIGDREMRVDAYRLEIHYHEQTTTWMREQRGRWLGGVLTSDDAPTKMSLASELGVSRPTLDKWIDR